MILSLKAIIGKRRLLQSDEIRRLLEESKANKILLYILLAVHISIILLKSKKMDLTDK